MNKINIISSILIIVALMSVTACATETTYRHTGFEVWGWDMNFTKLNATNMGVLGFQQNGAGTPPVSGTDKASLYYDSRDRLMYSENGSAYKEAFNNASEINRGILAVSYGGTGASDAATAKANLNITTDYLSRAYWIAGGGHNSTIPALVATTTSDNNNWMHTNYGINRTIPTGSNVTYTSQLIVTDDYSVNNQDHIGQTIIQNARTNRNVTGVGSGADEWGQYIIVANNGFNASGSGIEVDLRNTHGDFPASATNLNPIPQYSGVTIYPNDPDSYNITRAFAFMNGGMGTGHGVYIGMLLQGIINTGIVLQGLSGSGAIGIDGGLMPIVNVNRIQLVEGGNNVVLNVTNETTSSYSIKSNGEVTSKNLMGTGNLPIYATAEGTLFRNATGAGVTSVSGTAPVVSSGGATPAISMAAASTSVNGYLSSTDWNTFNGKSPAAGSSSITTVGTITSGTWSATDVAVAAGGTGASDAATARTNLGAAASTQEAWIAPSLLNSWVDYTGYTTNYMKDSMGFVHIRGTVDGGADGSTIFILPAGYRPEQSVNVAVIKDGILGYVTVNSSGNVICHSTVTTYMTLDLPSFKAYS